MTISRNFEGKKEAPKAKLFILEVLLRVSEKRNFSQREKCPNTEFTEFTLTVLKMSIKAGPFSFSASVVALLRFLVFLIITVYGKLKKNREKIRTN